MSSHPETVLAIDDTEMVLDTLEPLLGDAGYEIVRADSAERGLLAAREHRPDLILLDVQLPDLDGWEVCRRLKADDCTREAPVIFMTGARTSPEDIARGLELGATDYVTKPFHPRVLIQRVNAAMRSYRAQKEQRELADARARALGALAGAQLHDLEAKRRFAVAALAWSMAAELAVPLQAAAVQLDEVAARGADDRLTAARASLARADAIVQRLRRLGEQAAEGADSVGDVVRGVAEPMAQALATDGIDVALDIDDRLRARGAARLAPVVSELIANATRALGDRGFIRVGVRGDGPWVTVTIEDDGSGIDLDTDGAPLALGRDGGVRLGLPMCRAIVTSLGGSIAIARSEPRGTSVVFRVPAAV